MGKCAAVLCSVVFAFGFLSTGNGYFKVPGMKLVDSPHSHLLRQGPAQITKDDDDWNPHPVVKNDFYSWKTPQTYSFYHRPETHFHTKPGSSQSSLFQGFGHFSREMFPHLRAEMSRSPLPEEGQMDSFSIEEDKFPTLKGSRRLPEDGGQYLKNEKAEQRVVGGYDVGEGQIPWQISLQRKSMKSGKIFHICGGSIINKEWVVTAGHCVALALLSNYRVVAATTNLRDENRIKDLHSSDYSIHKVADVQIHDEYDMFRFRNDIALLRVDPPFEFGPKIQSIALPSPGHTAYGHAYASGWGLTQEGVRVTPSKLQAVELPIVSDSECRKAYGDNLADTMICAGYQEGGKSVCQGDSGGPLFQRSGGQDVLIGVVSWGVGCARPGKPGVYTEVSHYVGWIEDITGGGRNNIVS